MNFKLFAFSIIAIFCFWGHLFSQTILNELSEDKRTKLDKEMILEIKETFHNVKDSFNINFDLSDTLYIIHGVDIQSREGYGYIWNRAIKTSYTDNKTWSNNKLVSSNPNIEIKTSNITWYEFDYLIPLIEMWDTTGIKNYVDSCDEVLGGIYGWSIFRFIKQDSKYNFDILNIRDFGMCRNYKK